MRTLRTALILSILVACGAPAAPTDPTRGPQGAGGAEYDPFAHPCESAKDCPGDGFTCGTIGVGTIQAGEQQAPNTRKYCLREGTGDCCPPAAPGPR